MLAINLIECASHGCHAKPYGRKRLCEPHYDKAYKQSLKSVPRQPPRFCAAVECGAQLSSRNTTGFCKSHRGLAPGGANQPLCSECGAPGYCDWLCRAHYWGRYNEINKARINAYKASWAKANQEKVRESRRRSRLAHLESILARQAEWRAKNKEAHKAMIKAWGERNPGRLKEREARYRAARKSAIPGWLTAEDRRDMQRIYENCPAGHEVDHIYPLQSPVVCGLHVPWNLQYLTRSENRRKGNRVPPC